jgi:hypothetical protein
MQAEKARLTVLGTGWSNTAIDSGEGFTIDGEMWKDIATELGYDFGDDVDWDNIAENEWPDFDWSQVIYKTPDGNVYTDPDGTGVWTMPAYEMPDGTIYTDPDGDGVWTNPDTDIEYPGGGSLKKIEYPGGGKPYIPENTMVDFSDKLENLAQHDSQFAQYSIPDDVIPTLYGGKVGTEITQITTGSDRPHFYTPPIWFIQTNSSTGYMFLDEPFFHGTASGGSITVYDVAITIRDGSSKTVYYSDCTTRFTDNYLPSPYNSYPIQYVCWQCLYGSLSNALVATNPETVSTDDIRNGTSGLESIDYAEQRYYRMKDKQVADRL